MIYKPRVILQLHCNLFHIVKDYLHRCFDVIA